MEEGGESLDSTSMAAQSLLHLKNTLHKKNMNSKRLFYSKNATECIQNEKLIDKNFEKISKLTEIQNKNLAKKLIPFAHKQKHTFTFDNSNPLKKLGFYVLKCKEYNL
jgi:hypothetical protein